MSPTQNSGGFDVIQTPGGLPGKKVLRIVRRAATASNALHSRHQPHRLQPRL